MALDFCDPNNPIWAGLIGSASTWLVISVGKRIRTYSVLSKLSGDYIGYELDGSPHSSGKKYSVQYMLFENVIEIKQESESKGNWKAKIPISDWQPLTGLGSYEYEVETWGIISISINTNQKVISVESKAMTADKLNRYLIKKKQK